jgi:hypothetical protein
MTPAPTMVLMKLKDALATELSPPPLPSFVASEPTEFSEEFKGDSSSCPSESGIVRSSTCASPLVFCNDMALAFWLSRAKKKGATKI